MPIHLAPYLIIGGVKVAQEMMKRHRLNKSLTCRRCGGRMSAPYMETKCCGKPLCSDRCVRGYTADSSNGCIYHA